MKINNPQELSGFLKQHRKLKKRSQHDVAAKVGLQQQTISSFERQSNQAKLETLFSIVHELGLEFHLQDGENLKPTKPWQEEW